MGALSSTTRVEPRVGHALIRYTTRDEQRAQYMLGEQGIHLVRTVSARHFLQMLAISSHKATNKRIRPIWASFVAL
jgi:hypothetical protein